MSLRTSDIFTKQKRSQVMSRIRGKHTGPEKEVRALLTELGIRYRLNRSDMPGSPDIVISKLRIVFFIHGCFWHRHTCNKGQALPRTNAEFWLGKLNRNVERDKENLRALKQEGWRTVVIWECQLKKMDAMKQKIAGVIANA